MRAIGLDEAMAEGRRILGELEAQGARIERLDRRWYMLASGPVKAELVHEFHRRDWLTLVCAKPKTFVLSDPGLFWLRRQRAQERTGGDGFAEQHQLLASRAILDDTGVARAVTINDGESPLGWLMKRGAIDIVQFEAGERLRRDFTLAQIAPRLGADLGTPLVDGMRGARPETEMNDMVLAAKQRFSRAMAAAGPVISDLLFDVCCHLMGLEAAESARAWPRRTAKVVLQIGLDRLAAHYGLSLASQRAKMRGWRWEEKATA